MIENPTVLVLGAGASMDFGYPSGQKLKEDVVSMLTRENNNAHRSLWNLKFTEKQIQSFRVGLQRSGRPSVDAFLEHRPEFIPIGKAAMAAILMQYENLEALFPNGGSWYENLFQAINTSFEEFSSNKLSIITFNYDRSLETYLFEAIMHAYGKNEAEVVNVLKSIPIVHIYGKLSPLPWESNNNREYKPTTDAADILAAMNDIRIITEDQDIDQHLIDVKEIISDSNRLIFIGFGYHSRNIERLGIDTESGQFSIFGSAVGLTALEREKIKETFHPSTINLGLRHQKAREFLREMITF